MKSELVQDLIKEIADKYNISAIEVKKIITSGFKLSAIVMRDSGRKKNGWDFKRVYIPYFGSFKLVKSKVKQAKKALKKEEDE